VQLLIDLIPNLAAAAIGALAVRMYVAMRTHLRYRHLKTILPAGRVIQIVVPTTNVPMFDVHQRDGTDRRVENISNVLWVPLGASLAIGRFLVQAAPLLRGNYRIIQVTDRNYDPEQELSVTFGGEYVNELARVSVSRYLPEYRPSELTAEGHVRLYDMQLTPEIDRAGRLRTDYGFILLTSDGSTRRVVTVWGIHSPGTDIAGRALFDIQPKSEAGRLIKSGRNAVIVVQGDVNGIHVSNIQIIKCFTLQRGSQSATSP
jgi:hypothetical protein